MCHFVPCSMPAVLLPKVVPEGEGTCKRILMTELCAEHGVFELSQNEKDAVSIGDRLHVVPGYHDLTVVLHDRLVACRNGKVEAVWDTEGRGRLD